MIRIGRVHAIARYPVKSMAGIPLDSAELGEHGLPGDRRFAFRRAGDESAMPWLTASRLPELLLYRPIGEPLPTHVQTPSGATLALGGAELTAELVERF